MTVMRERRLYTKLHCVISHKNIAMKGKISLFTNILIVTNNKQIIMRIIFIRIVTTMGARGSVVG
jgi:hypothetical protein